MFDFNKYPTLIKFHKKYDKYSSRSTKRLIAVVDYNKRGAKKRFDKVIAKEEAFDASYCKAIFDILILEKPDLLNRRTNEYETWADVIGNDYESIPDNMRKIFTCLVEEDGGIYRLPSEYYL